MYCWLVRSVSFGDYVIKPGAKCRVFSFLLLSFVSFAPIAYAERVSRSGKLPVVVPRVSNSYRLSSERALPRTAATTHPHSSGQSAGSERTRLLQHLRDRYTHAVQGYVDSVNRGDTIRQQHYFELIRNLSRQQRWSEDPMIDPKYRRGVLEELGVPDPWNR